MCLAARETFKTWEVYVIMNKNHELTNEDVFLCESRLALRNPDGPWVQLG